MHEFVCVFFYSKLIVVYSMQLLSSGEDTAGAACRHLWSVCYACGRVAVEFVCLDDG